MSRGGKVALIVLGVLAFGAAGAEAFLRIGVGLGDPPLVYRDKDIDYLFVPNRSYRRFHNLVRYNAVSMRADEVSETRRPCEIRVLAVGDSVLNGGAMTDQADTATAIAQADLAATLGRPVWVGNASAGGWAPQSMRAYLHRFGWFDADFIVFVLSSHDYTQPALFSPTLGPDFPETTPRLAILEALERYLPRFLPASMATEAPKSAPPAGAPAPETLRSLLSEAVATERPVYLLHHRERGEAPGATDARTRDLLAAGADIAGMAKHLGVHYLDTGQALRDAGEPAVYRDDIHLNAEGQRLLGRLMVEQIEDFIAKEPATVACR